jgi:hypothetical protein
MGELNAQIAAYFEQFSAAELAELEHWALDGKVLRATHRQVTIRGIDIFRLARGEIVDLWQEIDLMSIHNKS